MQNLEKSLAQLETDADALGKTAVAVTKAAKTLRQGAAIGDLRQIAKALDEGDTLLKTITQQFANAKSAWPADEDAYIASRAYIDELKAAAQAKQLKMFEQDDRLFAYPSLVRVIPGEKVIQIDRSKVRRLRPTVVVAELLRLQGEPQRFRAEPFLEALKSAYDILCATDKQQEIASPVKRLVSLYDMFTLLPGQVRDYSKQEFVRDIYLLDTSGTTTTKSGHRVEFPASTGTKNQSQTLPIVTKDGQMKQYFGIAFR